MKTIVSIAALVVALAGSLAAQTLSEQLQRGIYTEETLGNKDEASRIYKQILAAPSLPAPIYAEAQRRLARLLLPVPQPQPSSRPPSMSPPVFVADTMYPSMPDRGAVEGNRYRNLTSGISFDVPSGWKAGPTGPSSDDGDGMSMTNGTHTIHVWMIKQETPSDQVAGRVAEAPALKIQQRKSGGYAIPGMPDAGTYYIPPDALRPMMMNGKHAMVAIASYTGYTMEPFRRPDGLHDMREYMAWIYTPHARLFVNSRFPMNVPELQLISTSFQQILQSVSIP